MTPNFDQLVESILQEAKGKKKSAKKRKRGRNKSVKGQPWGPWGYWGGYDNSLHDAGGSSDSSGDGGE